MAVSAEQGLRPRIELAGVERFTVALRMAFSAGVTARAAYAGVDRFETLSVAARGVASETTLHRLGTESESESRLRIGRNAGRMANSDAILMNLRKVADAGFIQAIRSADERGLALYPGSHDPFDETFGVLGSSESRDGDAVRLRAIGKLKSACGFLQRLCREIFAHCAFKGRQHGTGMSGAVVLRNLRGVTGGAGRGGRRRSMREGGQQQHPNGSKAPHRNWNSKRHYTFDMVSFLLLALALGTPGDAHQRGVELYKQQKYTNAIAALQQAASTETAGTPSYNESVLMIGQSYFMLSQAPKAIPWLEKLPGVNEANYMLGYAYLQTAQQAESEAAFARLFDLKPESAAAHLMAGQMMLKKEYEAQAVTEIRKALRLDAKLPEAHFLLGEVAIFRGQLDEAITELNQELALNPNFSKAWYRRGDAYSRQEKWNEAIPDLQRAVWLNPEFSGPYILLGKCYYKQKNYSNAEGILRRGLQLDPQNFSGTYLLGQTLIGEGRADEGRTMLERARALQK